jgi:hypothetical protein
MLPPLLVKLLRTHRRPLPMLLALQLMQLLLRMPLHRRTLHLQLRQLLLQKRPSKQ